jgi:hypothetical protein
LLNGFATWKEHGCKGLQIFCETSAIEREMQRRVAITLEMQRRLRSLNRLPFQKINASFHREA